MNCVRFQKRLHEYLDGDLSRWRKAAAEKHLARCAACRRVLERERQFAESLGQELDHAARNWTLSAGFQRHLARMLSNEAVETTSPRGRFRDNFRFAWAPSLAAAFVLVILGVILLAPQPPKTGTASSPAPKTESSMSLRTSYAAPAYVFHKEDGLVVDALSYRTNVVTETLRVENWNISGKQISL